MSEQITCDCGFIVRGNSQRHAETNLKIHKTSKLHKILIQNNREISSTISKDKTKVDAHNTTKKGGK